MKMTDTEPCMTLVLRQYNFKTIIKILWYLSSELSVAPTIQKHSELIACSYMGSANLSKCHQRFDLVSDVGLMEKCRES